MDKQAIKTDISSALGKALSKIGTDISDSVKNKELDPYATIELAKDLMEVAELIDNYTKSILTIRTEVLNAVYKAIQREKVCQKD